MLGFAELREEIRNVLSADEMAQSVTNTLADAVRRRHELTPDKDLLTVSGDDNNFGLLLRLNMIDETKSPIVDLGLPYSYPTRGPFLYFLNKKAVDYHAALAQEGFYTI